jgi:hypothetical protein
MYYPNRRIINRLIAEARLDGDNPFTTPEEREQANYTATTLQYLEYVKEYCIATGCGKCGIKGRAECDGFRMSTPRDMGYYVNNMDKGYKK